MIIIPNDTITFLLARKIIDNRLIISAKKNNQFVFFEKYLLFKKRNPVVKANGRMYGSAVILFNSRKGSKIDITTKAKVK